MIGATTLPLASLFLLRFVYRQYTRPATTPRQVADNMRNRFTKVEDARLISLRQGGALWVQIGAALERSPGSCRVRLRLLEHRGECEPAPKAKRKASVKKHCLRCRSPFRTTQPRQIHMCEPCKVGIRRTGEGDYVEHGLSGTSGLDGAHQVSARRPNY